MHPLKILYTNRKKHADNHEDDHKEIKKRIQEADRRFHSNDNISEFIKEGELDLLQNEVEEKLNDVLDSLVIDTTNDHNTQDTSRRVAKMWIKETFGGRYKPAPKITSFPNMGYKSLPQEY